MSLPVQERIIRNVIETCAAITTANSYQTDVLAVERPSPALGNRDRDRLIVVVQGNPISVEEAGLGFQEWLLPVSLVCFVIEREGSGLAVDARLNMFRADVERALILGNDGTSYTRGGLAIDTKPAEPEYAPTAIDAHEGNVTVNVWVNFRHKYGDPFSQ